MPPRRRDDDGGGGGTLLNVHRFAFVQHLMRHGCLPEADAKDAFRRLTGSDDGA